MHACTKDKFVYKSLQMAHAENRDIAKNANDYTVITMKYIRIIAKKKLI